MQVQSSQVSQYSLDSSQVTSSSYGFYPLGTAAPSMQRVSQSAPRLMHLPSASVLFNSVASPLTEIGSTDTESADSQSIVAEPRIVDQNAVIQKSSDGGEIKENGEMLNGETLKGEKLTEQKPKHRTGILNFKRQPIDHKPKTSELTRLLAADMIERETRITRQWQAALEIPSLMTMQLDLTPLHDEIQSAREALKVSSGEIARKELVFGMDAILSMEFPMSLADTMLVLETLREVGELTPTKFSQAMRQFKRQPLNLPDVHQALVVLLGRLDVTRDQALMTEVVAFGVELCRRGGHARFVKSVKSELMASKEGKQFWQQLKATPDHRAQSGIRVLPYESGQAQEKKQSSVYTRREVVRPLAALI